MNTKVFHFISLAIFLPLICSFPVEINAQSGGKLKVSYLSLDFPQVSGGDSAFEYAPYDSISLHIVNLDSALFTGILFIELQGDTGTGPYTLNNVSLDSGLVAIPGFDSVTVLFDSIYYFSSSKYKAGSNIVVVWPRLSSGTLIDSVSLITEVFFVPSPAGINDLLSSANLFYLYPNPANDFIDIIIKNKKDIEGVRFYDLRGRLLKEVMHLNRSQLDIRDLSNGCYFLELILNDQRKLVTKLMKL